MAGLPWPSIGAKEFLRFSELAGNEGAEGFEAAWGKDFFVRDPGLRYETHQEALVILDGNAGRLAHLSNNGGLLDPEGAA